VQSLRYGVSLYHLFQDDYFESLTELMVGQARGELGPHTENAELLRGGISLTYGMDREAERIFTALLSEPREGADRGRAWFYLARLAWRRGDVERAGQALERAEPIESEELAEEATFLRAAVALAKGDIEAAEAEADELDDDSPWRYYFDYNIGAALAANGDWDSASRFFRRLDDANDSEELKALRDRAFAASGYARLAAGEFDEAGKDFVRVRLTSPVSDRALLGYGWASLETEQYVAALSPWETLSQRPPVSQSVRESLLAIPYAYEQLGREGLALQNYRKATQVLQSELDGVQRAIERFRNGELHDLLRLESDASDEWLVGDDILPISEEAPYLQHLIASHGFQAGMKELRDLQRIEANLKRSEQKLRVLAQADSDQQANWARVIEGGGRDELAGRYEMLSARADNLRTRLAQAIATDDGRALSDNEREALWQRLERASELAVKVNAPQDQQELLKLYRGLLIWDDSEQFPDLRWRAESELASLESVLEETSDRLERLDTTIANRLFSNFAPRIIALSERVDLQRGKVEIALLQSESGLRQVAVTELERQARALKHSLGQSRLAVARLYDKRTTGLGK
jgi:outer membrane protein assembly factor BamD (BamD/ComL family)